MRDLGDVLDRMLSTIAYDKVNPHYWLKDRLQTIRKSIKYTPVEAMNLRWMETAEALHAYFQDTEPIGKYERMMVDIFVEDDSDYLAMIA